MSVIVALVVCAGLAAILGLALLLFCAYHVHVVSEFVDRIDQIQGTKPIREIPELKRLEETPAPPRERPVKDRIRFRMPV